MTPQDFLVRLLGDATLIDVEEAFSGGNPFDPRYGQQATAEQRVDKILVRGHVLFEGSSVGRFERLLFFQKGFTRAEHVILELADAHRGRNNARSHYRRALRFYDRIGLRFVHLMADGDGPRIWPQFGFDLDKPAQKERLHRILREMDVPRLPSDPQALFAPDVTTIQRGDSDLVGQEALQELRRREDLPLSMTLDLADTLTRRLLASGGILESGNIS